MIFETCPHYLLRQDFTKILLLAIFYAPFMPLIYFFCALIFMVQYWMDKFLLLVSALLSHPLSHTIMRLNKIYYLALVAKSPISWARVSKIQSKVFHNSRSRIGSYLVSIRIFSQSLYSAL